MNMYDFATGLIIGESMANRKVDNNIQEPIQTIKPVELTKIGYVPIKEIFDFEATIDSGYNDYGSQHLITLYKDNHIYYYIEIEVPISQTTYGYEKILDII